MGQINEYRRQQLVSSAVGTASRDQSGKVIGGAVTKLGANIAIGEAKRADMYASIQADKAITDTALALQNTAHQLQIEWGANPDKYGEELLKAGQTVISNAANAIQDPSVRAKFIGPAQTMLRAGVKQAPAWSHAKKRVNAEIAAQGTITLGTVSVGNSVNVDELNHNIATVEAMAREGDISQVLDPIALQAELDKNMPGVLDTYFLKEVRERPEKTKDDIEAGLYDKTKYYTKAMGDKYIVKAESRIKTVRTENVRKQTNNYGTFLLAAIDGNLDTGNLDAFWTRRNDDIGNSVTTSQKITILNAHVQRADSVVKEVQKQNPESVPYMELVSAVIDDRVDQADMYNKLAAVWADHWTSQDELRFLAELKGEFLQYQAGTSSGLYQADKDIRSMYTQIWEGRKGPATPAETKYIQQMMNKVRVGKQSAQVEREVMQEMAKDKVIVDNPNLAAYEDPVEEAYLNEASDILAVGGYNVDDKRKEILAKELRLENDRAK